ncbi:uncharacterized protein LOC128730736 isoform X2 [Anopheles nili]|uniref:uncharacterized protein LOC128730736 isoform X2 n=1 Tax=Anopheles nili TaxID=185578 RepID=UPI00237A33B2|nr:uncharacterized protein LOC128730736 isoform X2 [Anopheles nili]
MVKLHLICGVLLFAFLGWAHGLPVKDQELEEVLTKLQELKRLNDGQLKQANEEKVQLTATDQKTGSPGLSGAAIGTSGYKTKRSLNNSDRRTLLYNYYSRGLAPMYDKRNFDEIDRFARFNGKRNLGFEPSYTGGSPDHGYNGRYSKRNFDEIDRFNAGFNYRLNGDEMATIGKRNFDEIDRFGRFAFNKRYFPEVNELGAPNSLKHDLSEDMAVINEYSQ